MNKSTPHTSDVSATPDRIIYAECIVAGWHHYCDEETFLSLEEGQALALVRERGNAVDANAVAVALADDYDDNPEEFDFRFILGYVPRELNEPIARLIDRGCPQAFSATLTTVSDEGSYAHRLRMTITLDTAQARQFQDDDDVPHHPQWHAATLSISAMRHMRQQLIATGTACFRWGGYPGWRDMLPQLDDKVVFLTLSGTRYHIYVMHVVAIGDDPAILQRHPQQPLDDDCHPYLLTNVMGPVLVSPSRLQFLAPDALDDYEPQCALPPQLALRLQTLLLSASAVRL